MFYIIFIMIIFFAIRQNNKKAEITDKAHCAATSRPVFLLTVKLHNQMAGYDTISMPVCMHS